MKNRGCVDMIVIIAMFLIMLCSCVIYLKHDCNTKQKKVVYKTKKDLNNTICFLWRLDPVKRYETVRKIKNLYEVAPPVNPTFIEYIAIEHNTVIYGTNLIHIVEHAKGKTEISIYDILKIKED